MSKKVLILSGSPRKGGNSDLLCDVFIRGAAESGNEAEKIRIAEKNIGYCKACYACKKDGICAVKDDMAERLAKMHAADVIVLASPVYFYSIDAQLKTVIDRTVAQWTQLKNKEFYYIMTAAEDSGTVMECTLECMRGFAAWGPFAEGKKDFFTNPVLCGIGEKYEKSPAQLALRFLLQSDIVVIPKSTHKERMLENINVFDFVLTDADMASISAVDEGESLFFSHYDPAAVEMLTGLHR